MEPLRHHDVPLYPICCGALTFVLPSAFQTDLLPSLPNGWEHPRTVSGLSLHCLLLPLWKRRFGVHPSHSGHLHPTDTSISREEPCSLRSVLLCLSSDVVLTFKDHLELHLEEWGTPGHEDALSCPSGTTHRKYLNFSLVYVARGELTQNEAWKPSCSW